MRQATGRDAAERGGLLSMSGVLSSRLVIGGALVLGLWIAASVLVGQEADNLWDGPAQAAPVEDQAVPPGYEPMFADERRTSPAPGAARDEPTESAGGPVRLNLLSVAGKLAAVLVLAGVMIAVLRRWSDRRSAIEQAAERRLRLVETLDLGSSRQVMLLEASGHEIVVGADSQGVTLLADLEKKRPEGPEEEPPADEPLPEWFWRPEKKSKPDGNDVKKRRQKREKDPEARMRRRELLLEALEGRTR